MRAKLLMMVWACVVGACLTSCGDDDVPLVDVPPVDFMIEIVDAQGNNLLDPDFAGNILDKGLEMEYNGETYEAVINPESNAPVAFMSRAYLPVFYGLQVYEETPGNADWIMSFGEFEVVVQQAEYQCTLLVKDLGLAYNLKAVVKHKGEGYECTYYLDDTVINGCYRIVI